MAAVNKECRSYRPSDTDEELPVPLLSKLENFDNRGLIAEVRVSKKNSLLV